MKYPPIHHPGHDYRIAVDTDVRDTWRRNGFRPTTHAQRIAQQQPHAVPAPAPLPTPARKRKQQSTQQLQFPQLRTVSGGKP